MKVRGHVSPSKNSSLQVDFDRTGMIDKKRTNVYKLPVHDKFSLRFRIKGVKVNRVELRADEFLLSVLTPQYGDDWNEETQTNLDFFGDKSFHRGLLDVPVEVVISTDEEALPSIIVQIINPSLSWDKITTEIYEEEVTAYSDSGEKKMIIMYHPTGCGYRAI